MAIDKIQIEMALDAHTLWRNRLNSAIEKGTSEFRVDSVKVDNLCTFGKWLYELSSSDKKSEDVQKIIQLHAEFHKEAAEALNLALSGKKAEAKKNIFLGGSYNKASGRLIIALNNFKKKLQTNS